VSVSRETLRLEGLAERYGLTERQRTQLATLLTGLTIDERAPTTVRELSEALDVHLADSLVGLEVAAVREASSLADLGAGAGFPGLALAVGLPRCSVALVESQARKCTFADGMLVAAGVENARVVCARAEEWLEGAAANDVVTARALAAQPVVLEYAAPLLRVGGTLVDWRGRRDESGEASAKLAAAELGLRLVEIRWVEPYVGAREHHLHVYEKVEETPARYPRRTGVARKRPLGARTRS
jgi:16S rRNA (guanine527-N7)-methyltransferase